MDLVRVTAATFVILSVFNWDPRKGARVLLRAYWEAFDATDDVVLVLLTGRKSVRTNIQMLAVEIYGKQTELSTLARIVLVGPDLPQVRADLIIDRA
jgi:hypothetical protein